MEGLGKLAKGKFGGKARYVLKMDSPQAGVEEKYFSLLRYLENAPPFGRGYSGDSGEIIKTKDVYTAGETSSYWGSVEHRKGTQIDKFQQIMANVGQMVKALFQLLRELRILDERLSYYEGVKEKGNKGVSVVALFFILKYFEYSPFAMGLLLGGCVGNLIDRVVFGYVIDFIDVGFWPVFNIADSANTLGFLLHPLLLAVY